MLGESDDYDVFQEHEEEEQKQPKETNKNSFTMNETKALGMRTQNFQRKVFDNLLQRFWEQQKWK